MKTEDHISSSPLPQRTLDPYSLHLWQEQSSTILLMVDVWPLLSGIVQPELIQHKFVKD